MLNCENAQKEILSCNKDKNVKAKKQMLKIISFDVKKPFCIVKLLS